MKKTLLLSLVALAVSANVMADEDDWRDITPAAYNFNQATDIPNIVSAATYGTGQWNLSAGIWQKVKDEYKDGLIVLNGSGRDDLAGTKAAMSILDMGGTCGKVFAYNKSDGDVNADLQKLGISADLKQAGWAYDHLCWYSDPDKTEELTPVRVSMEINIHSSNSRITSNAALGVMKAYINTDQIGVTPVQDDATVAENKVVTLGEFTKRWDEAAKEGRVADSELDETAENEDGQAEWNPERWMLYEFDCFLPEGDADVTSYGPLFVKMELKGDFCGSTLFIRNLKFYHLTDGEQNYDNPRTRVWKYYTVGSSTEGITEVSNSDKDLQLSVNGNEVTVNENANIYTLSGAQVASVSACQAARLAKGAYIVSANGKSAKVLVK